MKYKQQSAENEGGEMDKNQQLLWTGVADVDVIYTQQPTGSTVEYENEQMRLVGVGGEHQKQHNNQPKWR